MVLIKVNPNHKKTSSYYKRDLPINPFKTKSNFNPSNNDAAIEIYLNSLEEELLKIEVPKDKSNNLIKGEQDALCILKMIKRL